MTASAFGAQHLDQLDRIIKGRSLAVRYMPIIDTLSGSIIAYETTVRGEALLEMPAALFPCAVQAGRLRELEVLCRDIILDAIVALPRDRRDRWRFFVNVSFASFMDAGFLAPFEPAMLISRGLPAESIIVEITDKKALQDYSGFERAAREASARGIRIALDEFGSGHSSLVELVAAMPDFIKLDRRLVHDVHLDGYRQTLVRSLVQFTSSVDTRFAAEGVETWEQLDALLRLGVRYLQGYLFGKPEAEPTLPNPAIMDRLAQRVRRHLTTRRTDTDAAGNLAIRPYAVNVGSLTCLELDEHFLSNPRCDHVVLLKSERPVGLLTRERFYASMSGPSAHQMLGDRKIEALANPSPTVVDESTPITALAQLAMQRFQDEFNDPILVIDGIGGFVGSVSTRDLMIRTLDVEVQRALDSNPLTGLPGNRAIERWIAAAFNQANSCIIYADLDHFKEFNDCYGFLRGDDLIRYVARVLVAELGTEDDTVRIGHLGGDDFIVVSRAPVSAARLDKLCRVFDEGKTAFFDSIHRDLGHFPSRDRRGEQRSVPLTSITLAVLPNLRLPGASRFTDLSPRAARIKAQAKSASTRRRGSGWLAEAPTEEEAAERVQ
jgi:EAL domain-containing protein (putative c-di-GMP-specific phosphodiesterase class I)/GGDEF domain-containing protein